MQDVLRECRRRFGPAPRSFSLWDRWTYLRVARPAWCDEDDKLIQFFRHREELLRNGFVVWGHIVQANRLMFEPGTMNCPAVVVFCRDPGIAVPVEELACIAHEIYELKGESVDDPELQRIGDLMANEMGRFFGLKVPTAISPKWQCAMSVVFLARHHLPGRRLCCPLMPLIVNPEKPHVAMPLPSRWWPAEFVDWWQE